MSIALRIFTSTSATSLAVGSAPDFSYSRDLLRSRAEFVPIGASAGGKASLEMTVMMPDEGGRTSTIRGCR